MLAQRAAFVVGPEDAALLQQRHDRVREISSPRQESKSSQVVWRKARARA
ncbi:MAG: hypothetical protein ABSB01_18445 [Streptosporangiaceae bacterium]|jgi:hypothetical protein